MNKNLAKIIKKEDYVCVQDEILVNCKSPQEVETCAEVMDAILNRGESVISMDYMDFVGKSDIINYDFEVVKGIDIGNHSEIISKIDLSNDCKYIISIVGNVGLADVTNTMEEMLGALDKEAEPVASFGFICDEKYQENVFDMYIWKER